MGKQRDANPQIVLSNLYKKTKLQTTFSGNLLALMTPSATKVKATTTDEKKGEIEISQEEGQPTTTSSESTSLTPQRFTLRESLNYFLDFRFETIRRKTKYQLGKVQSRIHI